MDPQKLVADYVIDIGRLVVCFFRLIFGSGKFSEFLVLCIVIGEILLCENLYDALLIDLNAENTLDVCIKRNTEFGCL